jgi:hypothetical protein
MVLHTFCFDDCPSKTHHSCVSSVIPYVLWYIYFLDYLMKLSYIHQLHIVRWQDGLLWMIVTYSEAMLQYLHWRNWWRPQKEPTRVVGVWAKIQNWGHLRTKKEPLCSFYVQEFHTVFLCIKYFVSLNFWMSWRLMIAFKVGFNSNQVLSNKYKSLYLLGMICLWRIVMVQWQVVWALFNAYNSLDLSLIWEK